MGRVVDDNDAPMCAFIVGVAVCWIPEGMSASDLKILAHRLMLLPIQVGFDQDVNLIVSCPVPVECAFPKGSDVGYMEAHVLLCVPCLLGWCAVKWWIVVWGFGRWQCPGNLSWLNQRCGLDAPNLHNLTGNLWCQKWEAPLGWLHRQRST